MGEKEGFRLKTIRLRGERSQGLLIDSHVLNTSFKEGDDVTEELGIVKYDPPVPANLLGIAKGRFPGYIPKTDEERIQNLDYDELRNHLYLVTEKLDGSSMTVYYKDDQLGVCSRNLELVETEGNSQWGIVTRYDLKKKLEKLNRNIAVQGEIIGYGIQKNHYKLNEVDLRVFKVWDITRNDYLAFDELSQLTGELGLQTVPVLE